MFITVLLNKKDEPIDFSAFLNGNSLSSACRNLQGQTRTYVRDTVSQRFLNNVDIPRIHRRLRAFNAKYKTYIDEPDKSKFYYSFKIPKASGGLRQIDAPNDDFKIALNELKDILTYQFFALHHNCAYAYISGRSTLDAVISHQKNNSHWFLKKDLHAFFPSTTQDFLMRMFKQVFPFSTYCETYGDEELRKALSICFLNGGLPQGTPTSPILTNIMMIPIDYEIEKYCRESTPHLVYTRYADDSFFSSRVKFDPVKVSKDLEEIYKKYDAPFEFNSKKDRFGSDAGSNWMLGVMLNKDNQITVGHVKKKNLKTQLFCFAKDFAKGVVWSVSDVQSLMGVYAQFLHVEGDPIRDILDTYSKKCEINILKAWKDIIALRYTGKPSDYRRV